MSEELLFSNLLMGFALGDYFSGKKIKQGVREALSFQMWRTVFY